MKRIVVVGGGLIGARHLAAVRTHPRCALAGLVDPDPACLPGDDVTRFADMSEMPDDVDGVIIATPTHLHATHGCYAASRGWHMLIEKPVAGDLAGAKMLQAAVAKAGVQSLVGHHRRYHRSIARLRQLIAGGGIGTPVTAALIWAMRKPDEYFAGNWRTAGGSPVMINIVHDIDILRHLLGEIAATAALPGRSLRGTDRIESGAVALAFESGATGTISFADTTPSPWGFEAGTGENPHIGTTGQDMMWITGTKGAVSFPSMTRWQGTDWSRPAIAGDLSGPGDATVPLDRQLDHFIDVMENRAPPLIDVADASRTLAVALEIEAQLAPSAPGEKRYG
ncbi:Gfo/Idh/MocA family protein [Roseobacter ponti]|uniref:Gfo/Idh/MocA family oxidoreductase n=1 Tax=Roseobacter ponti TaxID=1891787 RepID=A0A858SQ15_9RHOB|nr:Gfo/Idh/MocA family oxidoreductase [Roseobacter ponti]QJF49962.1 Gfo/Idh/MocA family oxidoreductase [Roseobacter ponti]